jgi:hypothetical protein
MYYFLITDMFSILAVLGFIYCALNISKLKREVDYLKKALEENNFKATSVHQKHDIDFHPTTPLSTVPPPVYREPQYTPPAEIKPNAFIEWLQKDSLVKVGALLLLIGLGWFVSYAFANNWIGPVGRITLGIMAGIAFMLTGVMRIKTMANQGAIFTVLGSTIIIMTVTAARGLYDFFTPETALGLMFMSVFFVAWVSVIYKKESMAIAGLILAGVAPFLTNSPEPSTLYLFSYLTVIVFGSLWVVSKIDAVALQVSAFFIVVFYSLPYMFGYLSAEDTYIALAFGFLFTVIFFITNVSSIMRRKDDGVTTAHLTIALGSGLYIAGWIYEAVPPEWHSLMYAAWALVFAFGAFVVYMRSNKRIPFYIYSGVSVGLLAGATAAIFDGPALTLAYTIEVTALVILATYLTKNSVTISRVSLLFIGPVLLSLDSLDGYYWRDGIFHADFFILLSFTFCLALAAYIINLNQPHLEKESKVDKALSVLAALYVAALIWLVSHAALLADTAVMVSLLIYTVVGLVMYLHGVTHNIKAFKTGGMIIVGLVIARLLLVDVWQMAIAGRIVTFVLIGMLLISTAFIKKFNHNEN